MSQEDNSNKLDQKKLLEVFQNRKAIWDGLRNKLIKKEHIEALFKERKEICDGCPFMAEKGPKLCSLPGTDPCCPECGCSLAIKLRSPDASCPKNFWGPVMTNQEAHLLKIDLDEKDKKDGGHDNSAGDLPTV